MATVHITLDLEPEVSSSDREKVLRSVRDRLKQAFGQRITVRTDEEASIWVAWLDENYSRLHDRLEDVLERVESAGQARVLDHTEQWFAWFDGKFTETGLDYEDLEGDDDDRERFPRAGEFMPTRSAFLTGSNSRKSFDKTIIYKHDEEPDVNPAVGRSDRRQIRIPTRK
ncbi:hypothetical protein EBU99_12865 [bacterium]|nr:hypothetical protein [bacterium]